MASVLLAAFLNVAIGIGLALVARDRIRADGPWAGPAFTLVALHAAAVIGPLALYFYGLHSAWAWLYVIDADRLPVLAVLPLAVGQAAMVVGGWYGAALMLRADKTKPLLGVLAGTILVFVIGLALFSNRWGTSTSYAGFRQGYGDDLLDVELGYALIVSLMAIVGSAGYVAAELARDSRRVRSR